MKKGELHLIPSYLGENSSNNVFPAYTFSLIKELRYYIVENEKSARKFIKYMDPSVPQNELVIKTIDKHFDPATDLEYVTEDLKSGNKVGLLSEAGAPCIADPGNIIVNWAHRNNIRVFPMVGPSSIFLALMASGFNGQNFQFHGYLPIDKSEKRKVVQNLEKESIRENKTQLFMETPYRNEEMFKLLLSSLHKDTLLCIACEISLPTEYIATMSIYNWQHSSKENLHKRPTIFAIYG